jgi:hypothetical protein
MLVVYHDAMEVGKLAALSNLICNRVLKTRAEASIDPASCPAA